MKQKLISLLTLLVLCVTGALAQDPTLSVEFTSGTKSDWLKNWSTEGITLSGDGSFSSSSGYYYGGCSSNASTVDGKYFGIAVNSSAQKIVKVSIKVSPNTSKHAFPVFVGWSETPALNNVSCFSAIEGTITTSTKADSEWITFDLNAAGVKDNIQDLRIYRKVTAGNFFESEEASKSIGDGKDLGAGVTLRIWAVKVWLADLKTISSQTLTGVKVGGSALTEKAVSNGYSIDGSTITLSNDIQSLLAPTNITLTNHIVYSDSSVEDDNVNVTFGNTPADDGYYSGTATIDETEYTVKVKKDVTPTLEATTSSVTVSSVTVGTGSQVFTVTGVNLEGDKVNLAFASDVDGLTVSPASIDVVDGSVSREVTLSYKSNDAVAASNVNLTISSTGVSDIIIPVNYSSTAAITTIEPISTITTWDWENTGQSSGVTSPDQNIFVVFSNMGGWSGSFNAAAISGKVKEMYASKSAYKYCQGGTLKFETTVPGMISIDFSNTGSKSEYRWLAVNGKVTEYKSKDETKVEAVNIPVEAGEVLIEAIMGTANDKAPEYVAANTMFNFRKIVFTPTVTVGVPASKEYATFNCDKNLDFTGVTDVYAYTAKISSSTVTLTKVDGKVPANEGLLIRGASLGASADVPVAASASEVDNDFVAVTAAEGVNLTSGYVLATVDGVQGFYRANTTGTLVSKGKAYLPAPGGAARLTMVFDDEEGGELTGISLNKREATATHRFFNLSGQRVAQPSKGLYIVNGKKVIVK